MTTMVSILSSPPAGAVAHPARTRKKTAMNLFTELVRSEADVGEPAALRAPADVLGELLCVEGRRGAVFPLDSRHDQRFAIGDCQRSQRNTRGYRQELDAHPAVSPLRVLVERKYDQPGIGAKRGHVFALRDVHRGACLRQLC